MSHAKILIVEDEAIEALDLQQRLVSLGYTITDIVSTGEDAIRVTGETSPVRFRRGQLARVTDVLLVR